ncbi:MAG: hypothetical protein QOI54_161 [Actinomycetota bacterium]|jgi:hypothetical protein|nr:hypothetical protein [Actinomycetota bacterium]
MGAHGFARGTTIARALAVLLAATVLGATSSASAASAPPPPPPPPAPGCEWYGELRENVKLTEVVPAQGSTRTLVMDKVFSSAPTEDSPCAAFYSETMDDNYFSSNDGFCYPDQATALFGPETYSVILTGTGSGTGTLSARIAAEGAVPYGTAAGSGGSYAITSVVEGSNACGSTGSATTTQASANVNAELGAVCQPKNNVVNAGVQSFAGACQTVEAGDYGTTTTVRSWRFAKTECDPAVDSDGGGVGDCAEFDQRTDPANAADDTPQPRDSDGDGVLDGVDACPTVKGNPAAAGCPDADFDGIRDSADNCPATHNPGQQNSDSVGPGDACEPVDAVDDPASGVIYVDYDGNQSAPPTKVSVLGNDVGGGRVLTNVSTAAKGTPTASADYSSVTFTPPHKRFVGPVEFGYGIRLRLDPPNMVRDSARVRLVYRACRTHTLTMAGTNLGVTTDYVRAKARLRVCTDGVTASSSVLSQSTWEKPFHTTGLRLLNKAIGAAVAGATRGALKLELAAGWTAVAKPGDSGVAARYVGCDRWTVAARYEHLSKKKRLAMAKRLRDRLGKVVGEKAAKALAKAVISHDFDLGCSTHVGYRSTMGAASSTGYDIKIRTTRNTGLGIEGTRLQADTSNNRGVHGLFVYHCPMKKDATNPTDSVIHVSGCRLIEQ